VRPGDSEDVKKQAAQKQLEGWFQQKNKLHQAIFVVSAVDVKGWSRGSEELRGLAKFTNFISTRTNKHCVMVVTMTDKLEGDTEKADVIDKLRATTGVNPAEMTIVTLPATENDDGKLASVLAALNFSLDGAEETFPPRKKQVVKAVVAVHTAGVPVVSYFRSHPEHLVILLLSLVLAWMFFGGGSGAGRPTIR